MMRISSVLLLLINLFTAGVNVAAEELFEKASRHSDWEISPQAVKYIDSRISLGEIQNIERSSEALSDYLEAKAAILPNSEIKVAHLSDFSVDLLKSGIRFGSAALDAPRAFHLKMVRVGEWVYRYDNDILIEPNQRFVIPISAKRDVLIQIVAEDESEAQNTFSYRLTIGDDQGRGSRSKGSLLAKIFSGFSPQFSAVQFDDLPKGTPIRINGELFKHIPGTVYHVSSGKCEVEILKDGFEKWRETRSLDEGEEWIIIRPRLLRIIE